MMGACGFQELKPQSWDSRCENAYYHSRPRPRFVMYQLQATMVVRIVSLKNDQQQFRVETPTWIRTPAWENSPHFGTPLLVFPAFISRETQWWGRKRLAAPGEQLPTTLTPCCRTFWARKTKSVEGFVSFRLSHFNYSDLQLFAISLHIRGRFFGDISHDKC